jgi:hypothetical protein
MKEQAFLLRIYWPNGYDEIEKFWFPERAIQYSHLMLSCGAMHTVIERL